MKDENLRKAAKPIAIATAMAAAATGAPVSVRIGGQTELRSTTDVREQTGQFQVLSPGLRGGVDVAAKNPDRVRETAAPGERYRVSVWKELPFLDLTSGLTYGTTTTGLTTSLSKELAENVTCVLDSTRPLRKSPLPSHEETVRLLYGISF